MEICKKIDIHAHSVSHMEYEYRRVIEVTAEDLIEIYDKIGVEKGNLMPILSPEAHGLVITNGDICATVHKYPDRFFWFCNVDPRCICNMPDTDLRDMLAFYKGLGAKGMGELTANLYADDPFIDNLFSCCEDLDMPVTIHIGPTRYGCYGIVDEIGLPRIEKMLKKHPKLKIFGHSQPFWAEIDANVTSENRNDYPTGPVTEGALARLLRENENLYCDMSACSCYNAMTRDPDYSYRFIEEFGDRMMFGIDHCKPTNHHTYLLCKWLDESAMKGCISEKNYRGICRENAIRILKLDK